MLERVFALEINLTSISVVVWIGVCFTIKKTISVVSSWCFVIVIFRFYFIQHISNLNRHTHLLFNSDKTNSLTFWLWFVHHFLKAEKRSVYNNLYCVCLVYSPSVITLSQYNRWLKHGGQSSSLVNCVLWILGTVCLLRNNLEKQLWSRQKFYLYHYFHQQQWLTSTHIYVSDDDDRWMKWWSANNIWIFY